MGSRKRQHRAPGCLRDGTLVCLHGSYAPGAQVSLTVQSGGADKTVQVTLGSQPDKAATTGNGGESQNPFGGNGGLFGGGN